MSLKQQILRLLPSFGYREKLIVALLLFTVIPLFIVGNYGIDYSIKALEDTTLDHLEHELSSKADDTEKFLRNIHRDILYLSETLAMRDLVDLKEMTYQAEFHRLRERLEQVFMIISRTRPYYDQIRYIDENGYEVVRVNYNSEESVVVPYDELQYKGDRYYYTETMKYRKGECYVSPMDLNIERGEVEFPYKPVVRIAAPVFDRNGENRGIVIINLFASYLIEQMQKLDIAEGGTTFLVNKDRFYLSHINNLDLGSGSFVLGSIEDLGKDYSADVVNEILSGSPGTIRGKSEIISFHPIFTGDVVSKEYWVLAIVYPMNFIFASVARLEAANIIIGFLTVLAASVTGIFMARRFAKPILELHQGVEWIAEGDFDHRLDIKTGDEIERLADRFNIMTDNLKESRDMLLTWNESLKDEVENRTRELEIEKNKFESILMCASEGIIVADEEDRIVIMNPAAEAILGVKKNEMFGRSIIGCHMNSEKIKSLLAEGSEMPVNTLVTMKGSNQLEVSAAVVSSGGDRYGSMMVVRDVTERQKLIEETLTMERQLLHADKLVTIGELSAGIAHEIGNPLAAMKTVIQSMEEEAPFKGEQKKYMKRILKEIDRLSLFIRTFSTFAHPKISDSLKSNVHQVLSDVLFLIKKEAVKHNIAIEDKRDGAVSEVTIATDQLKQVFLNLFVNAIHAMPDGGTISIAAEQLEKDAVKVSISDTGIGIADKDKKKIFDPFFTTKSAGTGLGLSIAHRIIREHKGDIKVHSRVGEGTTFDLIFPAAS